MFAKIVNYISDASAPTDAIAGEKLLRESVPKLLQEDEHVEMAFKGRGGSGRDEDFFTTKRILRRNVMGVTGTRVNYLSIPYGTIKAFAVETAGSIDNDVELKIWSTGVGEASINFAKGKVDILEIKRYFNQKVLGSQVSGGAGDGDTSAVDSGGPTFQVVVPEGVFPGHLIQAPAPDGSMVQATVPPGAEPGQVFAVPYGRRTAPAPPPSAARADGGGGGGTIGNFANWLGDNARQISAPEAEAQLKAVNLLLADEQVELAFRCGRDRTVFTTRRMLFIDVQGISGQRIEYKTILWSRAKAFAVETAGTWDLDAQFTLWTDIPGMKKITQDLRKGQADVMAVQSFFSEKILGNAAVPPLGISMGKPEVQNGGGPARNNAGLAANFFALAGDDHREIDPGEAERQFRTSPPLLQANECVELAFKGRRDMVLFTPKRLIIVDVKGWSGKKTRYVTVPWASVKAFAVESAGSYDKDSEMKLWTEVDDITPGSDEKPPDPGISFIDQDFQKDKVDLFLIQRYLAARCLPQRGGGAGKEHHMMQQEVSAAGGGKGNESLLDWLGQNHQAIDPQMVDQRLRSQPPILQEDERVVLAFQVGRDLTLYTTKRVVMVDTKGFSGKRVMYVSIPYGSIRGFSVESAGSWDRDAEVKLFVKAPWMPMFQQDLRKGKANVMQIQTFLAGELLPCSAVPAGTGAIAPPLSPPAAAPAAPGEVDSFLSWLGGDARQIDAAEVNKSLHEAPCILQNDENVDLAFKCGRDMFVFTTKRILYVDVQGWSGKKVQYLSIPNTWWAAFAVQTAGSMDPDMEVAVYTDVLGVRKVEHDFKKGQADLFGVQAFLASKMLPKAAGTELEKAAAGLQLLGSALKLAA